MLFLLQEQNWEAKIKEIADIERNLAPFYVVSKAE
jgi:hypothetical protein